MTVKSQVKSGTQCSRCGEVWSRDPALEVSCPQCHAGIGIWCKRPSEHRAAQLHSVRDKAALDAGIMGVCQGASNLEEQTLQSKWNPHTGGIELVRSAANEHPPVEKKATLFEWAEDQEKAAAWYGAPLNG